MKTIYTVQREYKGRWANLAVAADKADADDSLKWHKAKYPQEAFRVAKRAAA